MKELLERLAPYFGEKADSMEQIAKNTFKKMCYKFCVNENIADRKHSEIEDDYYLMTDRFQKFCSANGDSDPNLALETLEFLTEENKWSKNELDGFAYIYAKSLGSDPNYEYCPDEDEEDEDDDKFELRAKEYTFQKAYAEGFTYDTPIYMFIAERLLMFCSEFDLSDGLGGYTKEDFDERVEGLCDFYLYNNSFFF